MNEERDTQGCTPLMKCEDLLMCEILILRRADVNAKDVFESSVIFGARADKMKLLIKHKADVNVENMYKYTPLYYCETQEEIKLLVESKADVSARCYIGDTPLHCYCSRKNYFDISKTIIELKANPFLKNDENLSPFDYFLHDRNSRLIDFVISEAVKDFEKYVKFICNPENDTKIERIINLQISKGCKR